jgi:flagellar M-ring protein FliF
VQQLMALWQTLDPRKRLIVAAATLAMFAAVYGLASVATRPSMALLYAGIDGSHAGEVLAALDQRGVVYEVRGQAIYVESPRRDALRMELASEGLPANAGSGYELLDSLSGFGTTSQMFDAAYWRAKEGELARTIAALPNMRSVRVHISNTEPQGFRAQPAPKASVAVVTRDGTLPGRSARALAFLVASAVAGMKPEDVAIIDGDGGLIRTDDADGAKSGDDRAATLRENVLRILEARVGYGKAVVEIAVETVTESEAISERTIDPTGRVAISTENEEQTSSSADGGKGAVTVASNLPTGAAGGASSGSQSNDSQTRERVNYEVSETKRELVKSPGAIRRLTVAVLVDQAQAADASGQIQPQPRSEVELATLKDLVAAAVGFDERRGDVITIKSLPFEPAQVAGSDSGASFLSSLPLDVMTLIQLGVLALVSLVLGLFVVRPILASRGRMPALPAPETAPTAALTGEIDDGEFVPMDLPVVGAGGSASRRSAPAPAVDMDDPVARLRHLISERREETVEILRSWMEDPEAEKT